MPSRPLALVTGALSGLGVAARASKEEANGTPAKIHRLAALVALGVAPAA